MITGNCPPVNKKLPFAGLVIVKMKELLLEMRKNTED